ncbi:hypothetical protein N8T08_006170 [Aspergillus melleus]|uniref:Uncharacterized protein n=1 Tax=Aspergillus melleus TaxID=138277 RepID=A0ACC3B0N7_9EURO|nr:hypothetical protein N8T08_006170 [Aspergillus melleus]
MDPLLGDYAPAQKDPPSNEAKATSGMAVLFTTLASRKRAELNRTKSPSYFEFLTRYESVQFHHESELKLRWLYNKNSVTLTGRADYALWYGDSEGQEPNLVEAKEGGSDLS